MLCRNVTLHVYLLTVATWRDRNATLMEEVSAVTGDRHIWVASIRGARTFLKLYLLLRDRLLLQVAEDNTPNRDQA